MLEQFRVEVPLQFNERAVFLSAAEFLAQASNVFFKEVTLTQGPLLTDPPKVSLRSFRRKKSAHFFSPLFRFFYENITTVLEWTQTATLESHEKSFIEGVESTPDPDQHQRFCTLLIQLLIVGFLVINPKKAQAVCTPNGACLSLHLLPSFLVQHLNYLTLTPTESYFGFTEYNPETFEFRNVFKSSFQ